MYRLRMSNLSYSVFEELSYEESGMLYLLMGASDLGLPGRSAFLSVLVDALSSLG